MLNIPNILTVIRILLIPLCGFYIYREQFTYAVIVFVLASLTDIVDGYIARKFKLITNLGKFLDPLADKLLSFTTLTLLSFRGRLHFVIPLLIFIKELLIALGGILMYKKRNLVKGARWYGKFAAVLFFVSILLVMFNVTLLAGKILIVVALIFSYFALIMYLREFAALIFRGSEGKSV